VAGLPPRGSATSRGCAHSSHRIFTEAWGALVLGEDRSFSAACLKSAKFGFQVSAAAVGGGGPKIEITGVGVMGS